MGTSHQQLLSPKDFGRLICIVFTVLKKLAWGFGSSDGGEWRRSHGRVDNRRQEFRTLLWQAFQKCQLHRYARVLAPVVFTC